MSSWLTRSGSVLMLSVITVLLSSCATSKSVPEITYDEEPFEAAVFEPDPALPKQLVSVPQLLPMPGQLKMARPKKPKSKDKRSPQEKIIDANNAARVEPEKGSYINAIQIYPYVKGALYQLYAAVNQVTDIALEPGEGLISVSAGDTVRWVVGDTQSGAGRQPQVHILIKPIAADLKTNLVILTDRRTYHLEMRSGEETYMASVSWTYPQGDLLALEKRNDRAIQTARNTVDRGVRLDRLNFRYRIEGEASWRPTLAFDDGRKVYIQFPVGLGQGEAPPLFVVSSSGAPALVNYRKKGSYYVVDRLFAAAELRHGAAPQTKVRIVRTDARQKKVRTRGLFGRPLP